MKKTIIPILLCIISISCKREAIKTVTVADKFTYLDNYLFNMKSNCSDTILPQINEQFQFINDTNDIRYPFFNPNNPNEILYYKFYNHQVLIYDRISQTTRLLTNMTLNSPPKWGKKNWILLNSGQIFKIKENGDSLAAITAGYNPEWNITGDKFAYDANNGMSTGVVYDCIANEHDTLPFRFAPGKCWQNDQNLMVYFKSYNGVGHFFIADMNSREEKVLMEIISPLPPCWINENEFIYSYDRKIHILNLNHKTVTAIGTLCPNEGTGFMSYSSISNELITSVDHWKYLGENKIEITSKFMILGFNDNSVSYITP